jgi:ribosomal protein S18 acetylase RimI-like enzyme
MVWDQIGDNDIVSFVRLVEDASDAPLLAELQERIWRKKYPTIPAVIDLLDGADLVAAWKDMLQAAQHTVFLAYDEHGAVGYLIAARHDDIAEIDSFEIDEAYVRRGHGSRLMHAFVDTMPASSAIMWCDPTDEATRAFLTSCGWAADGSFRKIADEGNHVLTQVRFACSFT